MPEPRPAPALRVLALLVLLGPGESSALAAEEQASAVAAPGTCARGQGSLAYIGCNLAAALLPSAAGAEVAVVELKTDRELAAPDALRQRLQASVQSALGKAGPASSDAGAAASGKLRLELRLEKSGGTLRVTADLMRATGLWQRVRKVKPRALLHAFVEAPIDAELRTLIPPPPLVVGEVLKLKAPERGIVALACGRFGPEGAQELVLVSRSNVRVGRIAGRSFAERQRVAWSTLSSVAPAPLREPIATAEITPAGRLRVGISDRRDGVELDGSLAVTARFEALLPAPGGGCAARSGVALSGKITSCAGSPPAQPVNLGSVLDALAGAGELRVGRDAGTARLRQVAGELAGLGRVGAQLALGDADGDGATELAYSADVLDPSRDRLTVVSLNGPKPTQRFELPAAGITALAVCSEREGPGMAPLALVSGDELWLVR